MSAYTNYDKVCEYYDRERRPAGADVIAGLITTRLGKQLKDVQLLDLGCGTGNYAVALLNQGVHNITLVDGSQGMLTKAREKIQKADMADKVSDMKIVTLPNTSFKDNTFDAVMINQVLHHLETSPNGRDYPTILKTFEEVYRILKPGGVFVLTNTFKEQGCGVWFYQLIPQALQRYQLRVPSTAEACNMLKKVGFSTVTSLRYLGTDWFADYCNTEGPLLDSWRESDSFFASATEEEIENAIKFVKEMKNNGTLQSFFLKNDGSMSVGAFTIMGGVKSLSNNTERVHSI